jgi:hypothetical protein
MDLDPIAARVLRMPNDVPRPQGEAARCAIREIELEGLLDHREGQLPPGDLGLLEEADLQALRPWPEPQIE